MSQASQPQQLDGRRLRSERSKKAIIDAALSLMEEGILVATAQQVAERAGVGIRSFFRHFEDMESLTRAIDGEIRDSYELLFLGGDREGTMQERLEHAIAHRATVYDSLKNIMLSTTAQRWRYEVLRENYARNQRGLRKDLENWLPELKKLPRAQREAVDAVTSFEMWNRLREHQGQGKKASVSIVVQLLNSLMAPK
jgi:AcrR family transcriptional regulator